MLCPIFLLSFNQIWFSSIFFFFIKVPNVKFHEICRVGAALICVECPKLIDAFCDYVNTPKMGIKFSQQALREKTWVHKLFQDTV